MHVHITGDPRLVQAVAVVAWAEEAERAEGKAYFEAIHNLNAWRKWNGK